MTFVNVNSSAYETLNPTPITPGLLSILICTSAVSPDFVSIESTTKVGSPAAEIANGVEQISNKHAQINDSTFFAVISHPPTKPFMLQSMMSNHPISLCNGKELVCPERLLCHRCSHLQLSYQQFFLHSHPILLYNEKE